MYFFSNSIPRVKETQRQKINGTFRNSLPRCKICTESIQRNTKRIYKETQRVQCNYTETQSVHCWYKFFCFTISSVLAS